MIGIFRATAPRNDCWACRLQFSSAGKTRTNMNLQDIRYLVAVAELRHFGRAAEACNVSQPTLSSQIKKLEDELGVMLLERTNKRVDITPVGSQILTHA